MENVNRQTLKQQGRIFHDTEIDIGNKRPVNTLIHLVQYDNTLPIIAVKIYCNDLPYSLINTATASIRWKNPNGTIPFRAKEVLGRSDENDQTTLYIVIDSNMTYCYGESYAILEISIDGHVVGSSNIDFVIHRNPIQNEDIQQEAEKLGLSEVAYSGDYNDLDNKPSIEHIYDVIDASDIIDSTLTTEQQAIFRNGKPTFIKGTYGQFKNIWVFPDNEKSGQTRFIAFGANSTTGNRYMYELMLETSGYLYKGIPEYSQTFLDSIKSINGVNVDKFGKKFYKHSIQFIDASISLSYYLVILTKIATPVENVGDLWDIFNTTNVINAYFIDPGLNPHTVLNFDYYDSSKVYYTTMTSIGYTALQNLELVNDNVIEY